MHPPGRRPAAARTAAAREAARTGVRRRSARRAGGACRPRRAAAGAACRAGGVHGGSAPSVPQGRVGARGDQVGDGRPGVLAGDQGLADEDGVGARRWRRRSGRAGRGRPDSAILTMRSGISGATRSKVDRSTFSVFRLRALTPMTLAPASTARSTSSSSCASTSGVRPIDSARSISETRAGWSRAATISSARSAPCARASHSWYDGDDEVLAQHRDVDLGPDGLQVGERAAEAALLGQDGDHGRTARLVVGGQAGRVGDRGERALGRAGPLDLADHLDAVAPQRGDAVPGLREPWRRAP